MSKRQTVRCVFTLKDGSKCGRRAWADDPLQMCSVHGKGKIPTQHQFQPKDEDVDPLTVVRRVMRRAKDDGDRLRAADLYVRMLERQPPAAPLAERPSFIDGLTDGEREEARTLLAAWQALKDRVYARRPDLVPDSEAAVRAHRALQADYEESQKEQADVRPEPSAVAARAEVSEPAPVAAEADAAVEPVEVGPSTETLPPHLYPAVGLYVANGVVTHDLGDKFARRILSGEVPFEEAAAAHAADSNAVDHFYASLLAKKRQAPLSNK